MRSSKSSMTRKGIGKRGLRERRSRALDLKATPAALAAAVTSPTSGTSASSGSPLTFSSGPTGRGGAGLASPVAARPSTGSSTPAELPSKPPGTPAATSLTGAACVVLTASMDPLHLWSAAQASRLSRLPGLMSLSKTSLTDPLSLRPGDVAGGDGKAPAHECGQDPWTAGRGTTPSRRPSNRLLYGVVVGQRHRGLRGPARDRGLR